MVRIRSSQLQLPSTFSLSSILIHAGMIIAATIRVYMEKYEPPAATPAEGEPDATEPGEGAEDGEDANAKLYIDTSEALKDIVDAALQVSGLQVRTLIPSSPTMIQFESAPDLS